MYRGDSLILTRGVNPKVFTITDTETCAPIDLTGSTVWFTVKSTLVEPDQQAIAALKSGVVSTKGSVTILDQTQYRGQVKIVLDPSATINFPDGVVKLVYDVQWKDVDGIIRTIEAGIISVIPDATRAVS